MGFVKNPFLIGEGAPARARLRTAMLVEEELERYRPEKDILLTVGIFDGVHLGHRYLVSELVTQARQQRLLSGVVTFRQHPQEVLHSGTVIKLLTSLEERIDLLHKEGVDTVVPLTFDRELARLIARQFTALLKHCLRMRGLVIGPDTTLGKGKEGGVDTLFALGKEMGFTVTVVPPVKANGEVVSSTAIREALAAGDLDKVRRLTGRPFSLQGKVVTGAGRGKALGFPTANLAMLPQQAVPADGVYAGWAYVNGRPRAALANVGMNPTFGDPTRKVEVYLTDFKGDLYGRELRMDFLARLRGEEKFESAAALKRQMAEDVRKGKEILNTEGNEHERHHQTGE